jgi:hypothetical protein
MSAARSASGLMTVLALMVLTGCDSTQQKAARARLKAARFIASAAPTIVRRGNPDIEVAGVTLVRGSAGSAITVALRSRATHPLNDLPIAVGIRGPGGRDTYLDAAANSFYFDTHLASIAARGSVTWVFTTSKELPADAKPFAVVGARPSVSATAVRELPVINVKAASSRTTSGGAARVRVRVTNPSAVPQYQLQVYALGLARGRYVAAGRATIAHLGTGGSDTLALTLIGGPRPTSIELEALPTMFQ